MDIYILISTYLHTAFVDDHNPSEEVDKEYDYISECNGSPAEEETEGKQIQMSS